LQIKIDMHLLKLHRHHPKQQKRHPKAALFRGKAENGLQRRFDLKPPGLE
jgi:hypothetical protein